MPVCLVGAVAGRWVGPAALARTGLPAESEDLGDACGGHSFRGTLDGEAGRGNPQARCEERKGLFRAATFG